MCNEILNNDYYTFTAAFGDERILTILTLGMIGGKHPCP